MELAQDLKAQFTLRRRDRTCKHLITEILAEINREVVRTIYINAEKAALTNTTTVGIFDLDTDSNVDGQLKDLKALCSKLKETLTELHKEQEEEKVTSLLLLQMLQVLFKWQAC